MIKSLFKFGLILSIILTGFSQAYALESSDVFTKYNIVYQGTTQGQDKNGETVDNVSSNTNSDLQYVNRLPDQDYRTFTSSVIRLLLGITGTLCFVAISISGILFVVARDDSDLQGTAKKILTYAIYGVIVIGLSYSLIYGIARLDLD